MIIRPIEPREIDLIVNLFEYYRTAADIDDQVYDQDRVLTTLREYSIRPQLFFRAAFVGSRPVGCVGGFLSQDPVENETAATIQFLYLLDDYSSVTNYGQLIQTFEQWAKSCDVTKIRAIDIGRNPNRLQDVYSDLGFDPIRISIMNKEIQ